MANAITFNFESHNVRTVIINGDPWFIAKDLCEVLNIKNSRKALTALDDSEKDVTSSYTPGGSQKHAIVSESGMWTLILRCRDAVIPGTAPYRVRKWVTREVLPSIRKTGSYSVAPVQQPYDANSLMGPDRVITHANMVIAHTLIERARYLVGFWQQYEPAIRMLNSNIADSIHECFFDADWSSSLLAKKLGISVLPRAYFLNYPFHKESFEQQQYCLTHSRV